MKYARTGIRNVNFYRSESIDKEKPTWMGEMETPRLVKDTQPRSREAESVERCVVKQREQKSNLLMFLRPENSYFNTKYQYLKN